MANAIVCRSSQCRFARSGKWSDSMTKNPIYIGNNSSGSYKYIGQWEMPPLEMARSEIEKITLHIYRNSNYSTYSWDYYIGTSSNVEDYASVLSTGVQISVSANAGWKSMDVSGLAEYITEYDSTWYLLIGNPNYNGTYSEVAGYGSGKMLYLEIELSNGSKIYLASNGVLAPYQIYRAENGVLVRYDLYRGENGSLVKY